ncbi:hypothetical protein EMIT040CA3_10375 [Bacillus pseudomycoides]
MGRHTAVSEWDRKQRSLVKDEIAIKRLLIKISANLGYAFGQLLS